MENYPEHPPPHEQATLDNIFHHDEPDDNLPTEEGSTPPQEQAPLDNINPHNDLDDNLHRESGTLSQEPVQPVGTNPITVGFALVTAFALGLAAGFFGRPTVIQDVPVEVVITVVPDSQVVAQVLALAAQETNISVVPQGASEEAVFENETDPPVEPALAEPATGATPTIMDFVMADARHWQGDEMAPVVIVEFSDFK